MKPRALAVAWVAVAAVFVLLLVFEFLKYRSLAGELALVTSERQRLTAEIALREQRLVLEMRKHAPLLQEMQWSSGGPDPSTFLTRIAELAREKRMTITTIGPLQRQSSPEFTKSWHVIQLRAPYREVRDLVTHIEQDRGILEDVRFQPAPGVPGQAAQAGAPSVPGEIQASFQLVGIEMSPQGKQIIDRALAATGKTAGTLPLPQVALAVPSEASGKPSGRDPFTFLTPPAPVRPAAGQAGPGGPPAPGPEFALKGIVSFPDGFLAIVNDQIVKVGDTVSGYKVDRITENSVTLSVSGGTPRTIELPEVAPGPTGPPRR